ncbi:DUF6625 family protein [Lactobacillus helveticus]|uniref:DUF6625 family protein n=1 Tax=Lactobacillus helveticus TaxID=1587 RepID=UPI001563F3F9|nr:DUF6625 family protein [Lactobacillus helveticus]NRO18919.1 hypothetical protein [Lactobacillus helveticus]
MNKRKKVAIIIPYFGNFPNYFNYWLKSAQANKAFDFLIFTDNTTYRTIGNVKFINMTFSEFRELIQKQVEFKICLKDPYKICDYRPVFGSALKKYLKNYDFWGFGDVDVILGDLSHFITSKILDDYDKVYELGHLTLLRNNDLCNNLWRIKHHLKNVYRCDEAFKTPYPCHFDETDGLTQIAKLENIKTYRKVDFADIDRSKYNFFMLGKQEKVFPGLFEWKNGSLKYFYLRNNKVSKEEILYAHFQKRRLEVVKGYSKSSQFIIIPNKILNAKNPIEYIKHIQIITNYPYYRKDKRKEIIKKIKKHAIQQRVYRGLFRKIYRYYLDK